LLLAAEELIEVLEVLFVHSPVGPVIHRKIKAAVACLAGKKPLYDVIMTTISLTNRMAVQI